MKPKTDIPRYYPLATVLLVMALSALEARTWAGPMQGPGAQRQMREDIQETVEIYMLARLKRVLELDDEQTRTVIPLMEELNASRREFGRQRRGIVMRLRPLVELGTDGAEVAELLERLYNVEARHRETETRIQTEVRGVLTPLQQARFLFFQERFRQEMQQRLREVMDEREGRRNPR